ncbi:hypothetical protein PAHAL_5G520800 [Panicum hallii]|uniref:Uncharacterized protein n=1 Tax=Panicum hallii TaxID=206008 RepID=A0A2T8IP95_9POAL|nr:hypothetical protein PAHAL_5G520800 [Panicum hallii]
MAERRGGGGGPGRQLHRETLRLPGCGCLIRRPMRRWRVGPRRNGASGRSGQDGLVSRRGRRCQLHHT